VPDLDDRCTLRSLASDEPLAGTASTVRRWLLVESAGPWGPHGLLDGRLPGGVGDALHALARRTGSRVLLIRRVHRRPDVEGSVTCIAVDTTLDDPWMGRVLVPSIAHSVGLDPADRGSFEPLSGPLAVVCTHGRRDVCCAERGRPLAQATASVHPSVTWESTHLGGDRFAGNMVVFPHGLYFGHVEAVRGPEIVRAYAQGRIVLDRFRGRSSMPMYAQVAEHHLRVTLDLPEVNDLRLTSASAVGDEAESHFATSAGPRRVRLRRWAGTPMRLTCHSEREEAPSMWKVTSG